MNWFPDIPGAMSEWWNNTIQSVLGSMYSGLYEKCEKIFDGIFDSLNNKITWSAEEIATSPQEWNADSFALVQSVAENALMPIAGCILTFIFCWEIVHLVQESNHMQNVRPDTIMMVLLKFGLCILACTQSFNIVMGFFDVGVEATLNLVGKSTVGTFGEGIEFEDVLVEVTSDFSFGDILDTMLALIVLFLAKILIIAVGAIIYVKVNLWFMELLMFASAAPLPFATFGNKEWGQMGTNYVRKMLARCFEGFFMLLCFALFGSVLAGITLGDFYDSMVIIICCGFALCILLFKAGNIADSVFNAH